MAIGDNIASSFGGGWASDQGPAVGGYVTQVPPAYAMAQAAAQNSAPAASLPGVIGAGSGSNLTDLINQLGANAGPYLSGLLGAGVQSQGQQNQYNLGMAQLQNLLQLAGIQQQNQAISSTPALESAMAQKQLVGELPGIFGGFSSALGNMFGGGGLGGLLGGNFPLGMTSNSGAGFSFGGGPSQGMQQTGVASGAAGGGPLPATSSENPASANNWGLGAWSSQNPHAPVDLSNGQSFANAIYNGDPSALNAANNSGALGGMAANHLASLLGPRMAQTPQSPVNAFTSLFGGLA